jgi:hypothetical protein
MAQYRFLVDHYIDTTYIQAGTTASTVDVGGGLPINFRPSGAVDPLDTLAVNAFWAAGPQATPLVRMQWSTQFVAPPVTYWRQIPYGRLWQLTGLGAALPPIGV